MCSGALIPNELAHSSNDIAAGRAEEKLTQWFGSSKNHDYNYSLLQSALDLNGMDMRRFTVVDRGIRVFWPETENRQYNRTQRSPEHGP